MSELLHIEPQRVWRYFSQLCEIPRPSKNEEKIRQFLLDFAKEHKLKAKKDKAGNVIITKSGTKDYENKPVVILQSHMDMVGEKVNDSNHDFTTDPIQPFVDGDWVKAKGTTLGADDGIGIAAQLAILASDDIEHGPLECVFTSDEESGMTGAFGMKSGFMKGKILINLDSEDEGELFFGCAGGQDTLARFKLKKRKASKRMSAFEVKVHGLKGGHSGDEIDKMRGNAIKILNRFLWKAHQELSIKISTFTGGNLRNAIPSRSEAVFLIKSKNQADLHQFFNEYKLKLQKELEVSEPKLDMTIQKTEVPEYILEKKLQHHLLQALYACPHGVISMSQKVENLVETSTNLASLKIENEKQFLITTSQRSSVDSAKENISTQIRCVFELAGAKVEHTGGYPGWEPNPDSKIVDVTVKAYEKLFNEKPAVRAIHAGLECGLFLQKYPDLDMVSIGPQIDNAHTPEEKISITSTDKFWKHLLEVLKNIPDNN